MSGSVIEILESATSPLLVTEKRYQMLPPVGIDSTFDHGPVGDVPTCLLRSRPTTGCDTEICAEAVDPVPPPVELIVEVVFVYVPVRVPFTVTEKEHVVNASTDPPENEMVPGVEPVNVPPH